MHDSLVQLLLEELGSCVRRILARVRNRELAFRFEIPPCPLYLYESGDFQWCDYLRACRHNTTRLQQENSWMELLDVQMAVQSWIAGIEFGVRVYSGLRRKESALCTPVGGGNSMPPLKTQQPSKDG